MPDILQAARRLHAELDERFPWVVRRLYQPVLFYIEDHRQAVIFDVARSTTGPVSAGREECHLALRSDALWYAFAHRWGFDTLDISARFQVERTEDAGSPSRIVDRPGWTCASVPSSVTQAGPCGGGGSSGERSWTCWRLDCWVARSFDLGAGDMELRVSLSGERATEPQVRCMAGVGLLRGEFLFRDREVYVTDALARADLAEYVGRVCAAFGQRPVWYRLADFWSDEANVLEGNTHVLEEPNPIIGVRGVRRALAFPEDAGLEIETLARVARNHENLHLLLPFVQDGDEMSEAARLCRGAGWQHRIGSMVEIPSAVLGAEDLIKAGASNLLVGLNDLTSLLLGRERGPNEMKLHVALWKAISTVKEAAGETEWGIAGSLSAAVVQRAEAHGVPYVSVHYSELPSVLGASAMELSDLTR
ncbi:MAG: putative PEP-binding protein [Polyangiaceae bacterium]